jgi:hypothetical protein
MQTELLERFKMWVWMPIPQRMISDIGLTPNPEEVFSSNRDGGQGYDDIYKFLETKKLLCERRR